MPTRCPSCLARIARNSLDPYRELTRADRKMIALADADCTCNPLDKPSGGRVGDADIGGGGSRCGPLTDPGWKDDEDANGGWSNNVRAYEDA